MYTRERKHIGQYDQGSLALLSHWSLLKVFKVELLQILKVFDTQW
jgi:hypothetical protein